MQEIVEYHGYNCYIPSSGMCFLKCINFFTKNDYSEELLKNIRTQQRRSNVMQFARIQPFCRKDTINNGCLDGTTTNPRNILKKIQCSKYIITISV